MTKSKESTPMNHKEAHFLHRLLATFIDGAIGLAVNLYVINIVVKSVSIPELVSNLFLFLLVLLSPFGLLYQILLTRWFGGTLGKLLTGIKITALDSTPLSFKRVMFRQTIGYLFSGLLFGFGYLAILKNSQRQAWHDQAVGSLVVKTGNLWIVGLIIWMAMLGALGYFGSQTVQAAINNQPLKQEFITLYEQLKAEKVQSGLKIDSTPKAKVFIDDKEVGETPYENMELEEKAYQVKLQSSDANTTTWTGTAPVYKGTITFVYRDLNNNSQGGETITLEQGKGLKVTSQPESTVELDGKAVGKTPLTMEDATIGEHELILTRSDGLYRQITVSVMENLQTHLAMDLGVINAPVSVPPQATPKPVSAAEKAEAIKYWQDELAYLNQEINNLKIWINSEKDQTKINRMVTIANEQKAFATKALAKSQNDETFTEAEANQARKYAQMTEEYNKLLDEVFTR